MLLSPGVDRAKLPLSAMVPRRESESSGRSVGRGRWWWEGEGEREIKGEEVTRSRWSAPGSGEDRGSSPISRGGNQGVDGCCDG